MSKIRYPKCPYCGKQFEERGLCDIDGQNLCKLATRGGMTCKEMNEWAKTFYDGFIEGLNGGEEE